MGRTVQPDASFSAYATALYIHQHMTDFSVSSSLSSVTSAGIDADRFRGVSTYQHATTSRWAYTLQYAQFTWKAMRGLVGCEQRALTLSAFAAWRRSNAAVA